MTDIRYEAHGRVRLITIDRPDKMNSLDFEANDRLVEVWRRFDDDDDAYVAVVTGAGDKSFCAGANFSNRDASVLDSGSPRGRNPLYQEAVRLFATQKPVIAAVQGAAIGGGHGTHDGVDMLSASAPSGLSAVRAVDGVTHGRHPR